MARFRKNSRLSRLARLTSDGSELLSRINRLIGHQKEPEPDEKPQ